MENLLSIIIPCLNEEANVELVLDKVTELMELRSIKCEVIVVDDQSTDSTRHKAEEWVTRNSKKYVSVLYKDLDRRGYGAVVKYGLSHAKGDYAVFVSADLVDPIELLPVMYDNLEKGYDLVQVSRYLEIENSRSIPFSYKFFQFFYRYGVRFSLGERIMDSTYSFKMFKRSKILSVGLASNRFNISPEIMFKSVLADYKILFIPGSQGTRAQGVSKFKFYKEGLGFGLCLIRAFLHRKRLIFWF